MKKYELCEHVHVTIVPTKKFKDVGISIRFVLDLNREKASARSLLAFMLTNRTKIHPTNQELTSYLDDLYGTFIGMNTYSLGACHMLELRCGAVSDTYVQEEYSLLEKQLELIQEVLFQPLLDEQGEFDTELFEEAKMIMKSRISRREDDPSTFAIEESNRIVGGDTPFAISCLGDYEQVDSITKLDVTQAYSDMIQESMIELFVIGDVTESHIKQAFEETAMFTPRNQKYALLYDWTHPGTVLETEIEKDIDQSNLIMTWLTNINLKHPLFYALKVANSIFGGDADSYLFQVVREKNSLCYTIYSSIYSMDEVLIVLAGISYSNKEKATTLIKEQFERVCAGDFNETQLETSKRLLINGLQSQFDSANGVVNFLYQQSVSDNHKTVEEVIELIRSVSKEQAIEAMNLCNLVSVFMLKERNHEPNEE